MDIPKKKVDIPVSYPVLMETLLVFPYWVWYWLWFSYIFLLRISFLLTLYSRCLLLLQENSIIFYIDFCNKQHCDTVLLLTITYRFFQISMYTIIICIIPIVLLLPFKFLSYVYFLSSCIGYNLYYKCEREMVILGIFSPVCVPKTIV